MELLLYFLDNLMQVALSWEIYYSIAITKNNLQTFVYNFFSKLNGKPRYLTAQLQFTENDTFRTQLPFGFIYKVQELNLNFLKN